MPKSKSQSEYVRAKIYYAKNHHPLVKFGAVSGGCVFSVAVLSLAMLSGCGNTVANKKPDDGKLSTPEVSNLNAENSNSDVYTSEEAVFKEDDIKEYETLLESIRKGYVDNSSFNNDELKQWVEQLTKAESSLNFKVIKEDSLIPVVEETNIFVAGVDVAGIDDKDAQGYFNSADEILTRLSSALSLVKNFEIKSTGTICKGDVLSIPLEIKPEGVSAKFNYKSSDPTVFTVDGDGKLTAIGAGTAKLTVIAENGITRTSNVTISPYGSSGASSSKGIESSASSSESSSGSSKPSSSSGSSSSSSSSKPSGGTSSSSGSGSGSSSSKPSGGTSSSSGSSSGSGSSSSTGSSSTSTSGSTKPSGGTSSGSSTGSSGSTGSSSSTKPTHTHSYTSKTIKATCTSGGYTVHTCSCGNSYTDSYTEATGHKWGSWTTVKKATTSSEGRKERTCSSCGKTESKTIAKLPSSSSSTGGHAITGARKAVYSYRGMDSFSSVNLVDLINEERRKEGLCDLEWTANIVKKEYEEDQQGWEGCYDSNGNFDPYLVPEVREPLEGAQKMADMGYATHENGVGCSCVGESNFPEDTIEDALRRHIRGYLNSPPHRKSLMNAGSHRVTAAYAIGADGTVYTAILIGG